jgi:hypothetical protein
MRLLFWVRRNPASPRSFPCSAPRFPLHKTVILLSRLGKTDVIFIA